MASEFALEMHNNGSDVGQFSEIFGAKVNIIIIVNKRIAENLRASRDFRQTAIGEHEFSLARTCFL
ncbi:MAG: hypothetical protein GY821_08750 [Gammaproteobacteria bacterium]|nr:hypothetical protein [Gammaproteobacteria bacterium]